jgi:hypothetical protein
VAVHTARRRSIAVGVAGAVMSLLAACAVRPAPVVQGTPSPSQSYSALRARTSVVAVGDISPPEIRAQRATSDLALQLDPSRVLMLGDGQYPDGSLADFRRYYGPTWGRLKRRTLPAPGNHEYRLPGAEGYFDYFGRRAGPRGKGYYSADLGRWHLVALNSNIGRGPGSAQATWLARDLAGNDSECVLAFWHHPRFSSGVRHGDDDSVDEFWRLLYAAKADVVLNGHEHNYERFGRQDPTARADSDGLREFVVGTGGNSHYPFGNAKPLSEKRITERYGVLQLALYTSSYEWRFVAADGEVLDSGGPEGCH